MRVASGAETIRKKERKVKIQIIKNATPDRVNLTDVFVEIGCDLRATVPHDIAHDTAMELYATAIERMRSIVSIWDSLKETESAAKQPA